MPEYETYVAGKENSDYEAMLAERKEKRDRASRAAHQIAALVFADFNIEVSPEQVSKFIKGRWERVAPLAHAVHEAPDNTKSVG